MNKPLSVLADELEQNIEKLSKINKALEMMTPKVCRSCRRLIIDQDSLIMMYHEGECPSCSHSYGESLEK